MLKTFLKLPPSLRVPLALAVLAVVLLGTSVPSLVAAFLLLPGNATHEALLAGDPVSDQRLSVFMTSRQQALAWRASNAVYDDLAMGGLELARRQGFPATPTLRPDLQQALAWQIAALRLSPADTYGWSRLAYMLIVTEGRTEAAAQALAHSIEAAPYEPHLMIPRINMALVLGDVLPPDVKEQMPQLIAAAWKLYPQDLAQSAVQGHFTAQVTAALRDDPQDLAKWQKSIR